MTDEQKDRALDVAGRIFLCALFLLFGIAFGHDIYLTHRISSVFLMAHETLTAFFFLTRRFTKNFSRAPVDWIAAMFGTYLPFLLRPSAHMHDVWPLIALQIIGFAIALIGLINLNRSFGLVPANRGVQQSGMYRYIRHPLYAGYLLGDGAFVLMNLTFRNIGILLMFYAFQIVRIYMEENLLSNDPAYQAYKARVRWRLLPFVF